jgi:PEP-CTERM motif-containing protein
MHAKKRFLVATLGAVVALTVQTPVSAYIVKAREAAGHSSFGSHPPSYLIEAFRDAGQRVLQADNRWNGWRASTPGSTLANDDGASEPRSSRFDSTLGEIDLHRLAETTHGQNGSGGGSSSGEGGEGAHASAIGGNGGRGYGGGGAGGPGGGGGGGASGSSGHGSGAGEANDGSWHNASFDGPDAPNGQGGGTEVFTSGSGGLFSHNWGGGNWGSNGSGSDDSNFCDHDHGGGGGVGEQSVPEPTTLLFLAGGLAGLAARRRRSSAQGPSAN